MFFNPMTACDFYKLGHLAMDPPGVRQVVSTWTPRNSKNHPDCPNTVNFGYQWSINKCLVESFKDFFTNAFVVYANDFRAKMESAFNQRYIEPIVEAFSELHELGYLPLEVRIVPEGYLLPDGCPAAMIFNTDPRFSWLPQFLEDLWSMHSWLPSTSATTAYYRRKAAEPFFDKYAAYPERVRDLCSDFSMRGMTGQEASAISSAGHLLSFTKTATIDANSLLQEYYGAGLSRTPPSTGVPSLEHSVVEKGVAYFKHLIVANDPKITLPPYSDHISHTKDWDDGLVAEMCFMIFLLTEVQPTGVFTYVSDTYDFWGVLEKILPEIRPVIMSREGKLVIRPDSGDPIKVILGDPAAETLVEREGAIRTLASIFGAERMGDSLVLDSHIGLIYADAITAERQEAILKGLVRYNISPECISLGIGAYTYQYVTRDTRGFAIKAVDCFIDGIGEVPICKAPKTDPLKKSQRGAVAVYAPEGGNIIDFWVDGLTLEQSLKDPENIMTRVFCNGKTSFKDTIYSIRDRLWNNQF